MTCEVCHDLAPQRPGISLAELVSAAKSKSCDTCHLLWNLADRFKLPGLRLYLDNSTGTLRVSDENFHKFIVVFGVSDDNVLFHPAIKDGRLVSTHSSTEESFLRASEWIRKCVENHKHCNPTIDLALPTRVIDLGLATLSHPFLLEGRHATGRYATLSYCWGSGDQEMLTEATFESFKERLPMDKLSQTVLHAINICKRLKIPYLWVDALCIIQGDSDDWARESSNMCQIYSQSFLTIVAASSADSSNGIFTGQDYSLNTVKVELGKNTVYARLHPNDDHLGRPLKSNLEYQLSDRKNPKSWLLRKDILPLVERAWTVQERVMSQRALYYTSKEMWWECNSRCECECGWVDTLLVEDAGNLIEDHDGTEDTGSYNWLRNPQIGRMDMKDAYRQWERIVSLFSVGKLTDADDKLPALSGVAEQFETMLLQRFAANDTYLAGLWRGDLPIGLCWYSPHHLPCLPMPSYPSRSKKWRAPSWSWASVDGLVQFQQHANSFRPLCEIKRAEIELGTQDKRGRLVGGKIELEAHLVHTTLTRAERDHGSRKKIPLSGFVVSISSLGRNHHFFIDDWRDWQDFEEGTPCLCLIVAGQLNESGEITGGEVFLVLKQSSNVLDTYERIGLGITDSRLRLIDSANRGQITIV
jgi:hypothetical protein